MKEGDKTNENRNISEWLNIKKLNVKNWEKKVKIHRTKCYYLYHEVVLQFRKKTIQKENMERTWKDLLKIFHKEL